jgi:hypothetical protein
LSIVFESDRSDALFQSVVKRIGGLDDHTSQEALLCVAKTIGKSIETPERRSAL